MSNEYSELGSRRSKHKKIFFKRLFIMIRPHTANFRENPFRQPTKRHLNNSCLFGVDLLSLVGRLSFCFRFFFFRFTKQTFAQLRSSYVRRTFFRFDEPELGFAEQNVRPIKNGLKAVSCRDVRAGNVSNRIKT